MQAGKQLLIAGNPYFKLPLVAGRHCLLTSPQNKIQNPCDSVSFKKKAVTRINFIILNEIFTKPVSL